MWRVTAIGYETGAEYIYEVRDKPKTAKHHTVVASAIGQHARCKLRGEVHEYLRAGVSRVEYIEDVPRETSEEAGT